MHLKNGATISVLLLSLATTIEIAYCAITLLVTDFSFGLRKEMKNFLDSLLVLVCFRFRLFKHIAS